MEINCSVAYRKLFLKKGLRLPEHLVTTFQQKFPDGKGRGHLGSNNQESGLEPDGLSVNPGSATRHPCDLKASYFTSLSLGFFIYKMELLKVLASFFMRMKSCKAPTRVLGP